MKTKIILLVLLIFSFCAPISAQAPFITTSVCFSNSTSATTVNLDSPSSDISILVTPAGSNVYVNFNGTATTSNFEIPSGFAYSFNFPVPISSFSVIADGTSGKYGVFAH